MNASIELNQRRQTFLYVWVLLALLLLLVTATYTYFSISRTPSISDMALYVNAGEGLELANKISAPAEEWTQWLDYSSLVSVDAPLRPVSWSQSRNAFVMAQYGLDGRMLGTWATLNDPTEITPIAERYYALGTFYARTGQACDVSLAEAVELNEGQNGAGTYVIGAPVWNDSTILHSNGGNGAECAVRFGFRITHMDANGNPNGRGQEFFIYEPNSTSHLNDSTDYVPTPSVDGDATLVDADHLILQTASTWSEAYPVQRTVTIHDLGEFSTGTQLFRLQPDEVVQIKLYIWLEGQDIDCTNVIEAAKIFANIQFHTDYTGSSGMVDIP